MSEIKIQNTKIRKGAYTNFKSFKAAFENVLKGDLKQHYYTYSGRKVK